MARIAIVAHEVDESGGTALAMLQLTRRVARHHDVIMVADSVSPAASAVGEWRRVSVPRRPFLARFTAFWMLAHRELARLDVDLIHTCGAIVPDRVDLASVHSCHAAFLAHVRAASPASPASRLEGALHRVNRRLVARFGVAAERWCYPTGRVRAMVAASEGLAEELVGEFGVDRPAVAPNGVDHEVFHPDAAVRTEVRSAAGVSEDDVVFLFVGGDWERKGLGIIVEALAGARAAASGDRRLVLWVVGSGPRSEVQRMARDRGLDGHVVVWGHRTDVDRFCKAADVSVLASAYETYSLGSHEAAACGLPVIAGATHGVRELIGNDEAGLLVDRNVDAFASAMSRLAEDPGLRGRLGEEGRRRAERHTWDRSAEVVLGVYEELLAPVAGQGRRKRNPA